jgi:hypothetical protein
MQPKFKFIFDTDEEAKEESKVETDKHTAQDSYPNHLHHIS